ncbi:MAG: PAS domain S-box protein [Candidatus Marinimicrobia bacterium]|nr:PAS domain S-box protein [Candidatus Neomarinimicrobiota bacterium]MCF7828809.1 PAS domain S-box protein [Candidatus Neomarinimicrobiota bacterium]MCF7880726.1 PAS domain S-box protein [Candidatus Neomarinimicrobiota bacterium]
MGRNRRRIWIIAAVLAATGLIITASSVFLLYQTAIEEEELHLLEKVRNQEFLIEELSNSGMSKEEILIRVSAAQQRSLSANRRSEFVLGTLTVDSIHFIMNRDLRYPERMAQVPLTATLGEPMQRALAGYSGTVVGHDYRGVKVLGACGYIDSLNWGIVAKVNLAAIREPYLRAGGIAGTSALLLIALAVFLIIRNTNPIITGLEKHTRDLRERMKELRCMYSVTEIAGRKGLILTGILQEVVSAIPSGWQYPDSTAAQIVYGHQEFVTSGYTGNGPRLESALQLPNGTTGSIRVERTVLYGEEPFIPEEQDLLDGIASTLSRALISRQTEEALKESEAKYRELFNNMPIGLYRTSSDGKFLEANEALARILGFDSQEELLKTEVLKVYANPEDRKKWQEKLAKDGLVDRHEVEIRRKDGSTGWVQHSARTVTDDAGNVMQYEGAVEEITLRKQAERQLRKSEEQLRRAQQVAHIGSWYIDLPSNVLEWTGETYRIFGVPIDTPMNYDLFLDRIHPEDRAMVDQAWQTALDGGGYSVEHRITVNGEQRWVIEKAEIIFNDHGEPVKGIGTVHDITERKQYELALQKNEERFRAMIQNASDLITVINPEGIIQYDSPSIQRILGYKPHDRLGTSAFEYIYPDEAEIVENALSEVAKTPGKTLSLHIRIRNAAGDYRVMEITGSNMLDEPAIRGIVANARDVTERVESSEKMQAYSEELERSNKELEQFAYVASHDLQEPLRMVTSYLQLLERRYGGQLDSDADEFIEFAVDGANRMKTLIVDLLKYSRVNTRGNPFEETNLNSLVNDVLEYMKMAVDEKSAVVLVGELPELPVDRTQIAQVFQNLIGNGLKYSGDAPPEIHISAKQVKNVWRFKIQDNGIGIAPEHRQRIFGIFERLHGQDEYGGGTGIGLSVTKRIVERHGGDIWVESEPGNGSTFYFTIGNGQE